MNNETGVSDKVCATRERERESTAVVRVCISACAIKDFKLILYPTYTFPVTRRQVFGKRGGGGNIQCNTIQ